MSLIAEFQLTGDAIPLTETLDAVPGLSLHVEQAVAADPEQPVVFAWVRGDGIDEFESLLEGDETVAKYELVESLREESLYRFRISAAAEVVFYALDFEVGVSRLDMVASHEGVDVRMRFPDQAALQEYFRRCRDHGVSVSLGRLYRDRSGDGAADAGDDYGLSAKQRRALEDAYSRGFYDVPRGATLSDVAASLGVSEQATSERLRRATATLVGNTLDPPEREPFREA